MDKAMRELAGRTLANSDHLHKDMTLAREYPLSEKLMAISEAWRSSDTVGYLVAAKGAPEAIADLCHFEEKQLKDLHAEVIRMADDGLRVIGVARARFNHAVLPTDQHDFAFEFVGLLGLSDPIRPEVPNAVKECYTAGIRVIMITGDYPVTAKNIARQIGLKPLENLITGPELDRMNDADLQAHIRHTCIFARVIPEQKLRIVNALKANGEVVAMTGDGVNDAPALKAAHIGIAMGGRGTDVARESAALVLLDDNFASIVAAVKMGRRIFDNLKKAMAFIFSVHIPIAGMSILPVLFREPLALLPAHVLFLELIIDPACSVVFEMEAEEPDVMQRPPRKLDSPLFGRAMIFTGLIQGFGILAVVAGVYGFALNQNLGEGEARMFAFVSLVIGNLGLIFSNRSRTLFILQILRIPNKALWWVSGGALFFLALVLGVPALRELFQFAPLHRWEILLLFVTGFSSLLFAESVKLKVVQNWIAGNPPVSTSRPDDSERSQR
jgi:Ca2+-transporting ATPase